MAGRKLTVVISQAPGKNPRKRKLEEDIAAALIMEGGVDVSLVPNLYDMSSDHTGMLFLRSVPTDLVFLSWHYPRAVRWTLDRQGVRGQEGVTLLVDEEADEEEADEEDEPRQGIGSVDVPNRSIYCIDLRVEETAAPYLEEIRRIAREQTVQTVDLMSWVNGSPDKAQMERYLNPLPLISPETLSETGLAAEGAGSATHEPVKRRWYPVIDYSRCTNCMECIDFCLFGVYGVDTMDRILVEAQDNCKKGCPACSRVCPENAIIFPEHKTPAIAGADGEVAGLKIDLSQLFGGPAGDALETAVAERDVELVNDGRDAVGMTVGIPKRQTAAKQSSRDELDDLMDGLDDLDF